MLALLCVCLFVLWLFVCLSAYSCVAVVAGGVCRALFVWCLCVCLVVAGVVGGFWLSVVGGWLLVVGGWWLVVGCWLLVDGSRCSFVVVAALAVGVGVGALVGVVVVVVAVVVVCCVLYCCVDLLFCWLVVPPWLVGRLVALLVGRPGCLLLLILSPLCVGVAAVGVDCCCCCGCRGCR